MKARAFPEPRMVVNLVFAHDRSLFVYVYSTVDMTSGFSYLSTDIALLWSLNKRRFSWETSRVGAYGREGLMQERIFVCDLQSDFVYRPT